MDMESTSGLMVENLQETGSAIRCMEPVFLPGLTVEGIKEIITMTKNKDMEFSLGQTEENMMVLG